MVAIKFKLAQDLNLKLIAMSATIDASEFANYFSPMSISLFSH